MEKGQSPFSPGQPVSTELFVGRLPEINRIVDRGIKQVAAGKPMAFFIEGEYGIGKSSIARFTEYVADTEFGLHPIHVMVGGAMDLNDMAAAILQAVIAAQTFTPQRVAKIRNWLAKYIGKQTLGGISLNMDQLRTDAPTLATPFGLLGFLGQAMEHLSDMGVKGLYLVLDEINGLASNPAFAHFLKGLVESNGMSSSPIPLMLVLCGTPERRGEIIHNHPPVARTFDVVRIEPLSHEETKEFFRRAFESARMAVVPDAMSDMVRYSAGFPKLMHLIGDAAYWRDRDGVVDLADARMAVMDAAREVGMRFLDQQVYEALQSKDYQSILQKIGSLDPEAISFTKSDVDPMLTSTERSKFSNFIAKMKMLRVIKPGAIRGEYLFASRMDRMYMWLRSVEDQQRATK